MSLRWVNRDSKSDIYYSLILFKFNSIQRSLFPTQNKSIHLQYDYFNFMPLYFAVNQVNSVAVNAVSLYQLQRSVGISQAKRQSGKGPTRSQFGDVTR